MKKTMILATGVLVAFNMPAFAANEVTETGSARWEVASGAATKEDAVAQAKEQVMAIENNPMAMPSDINVLLPTNYIQNSFKIDGAKFYVSEYYDMNGGPFFEVNAFFNYTYKRKDEK